MLDLPPRISEWLLTLVSSQRAVGYLLIDADQTLVKGGGDLEYYGLTGLRHDAPASEQLPFLEGLLPLPESPFLLRSIEMPSGRVADVHFFDEGDTTWVALLDVTAERDEAQKIQQKAYDMTLLSQREARFIAKLETAHRALTQAHHELAESREALVRTNNRLQRELRNAERYVRAILPAPLVGPFGVEWLFVPSAELGGDSFGYHWLDPEHFVLYLLDVSGHGVGSALLSVAAANTLRSGALPQTDFHVPEQVLGSLNRAYQMEHQNQLYFTIWYGVYHRPTGRLRYASAGHPPPVLVSGPKGARGDVNRLPADGPPVGMWPTSEYQSEEFTLSAPARIFVFSDGVYEIDNPEGDLLEFSVFEDVLTRACPAGRSELDELLQVAREFHGDEVLGDDFSIIKMTI